MDFSKKKILVFSPYGTTKHYGESIIKELQKRGSEVFEYDERPSQSTWMKIIIRLFKKKVPYIFDKYCKKIINRHLNIEFDYILICRGEAFTPSSLALFRKAFPKAKIILYLWDILKCCDVRANIPLADKAFSFDPEDVGNNEGLFFRPTFFINEYLSINQNENRDYDIVFIGTLHSNRYEIIRKINYQLQTQCISSFFYLFLPSRLVYLKDWIKKFPYIGYNSIHFYPLTIPSTLQLLSRSRAILDINYSGQKSLSTRAFEAMASKRKFITTNPEIKKYDFYDPENILVIDLENLIIPKSFLNSPFNPIPEEILYKYSVAGLLDDLFGE